MCIKCQFLMKLQMALNGWLSDFTHQGYQVTLPPPFLRPTADCSRSADSRPRPCKRIRLPLRGGGLRARRNNRPPRPLTIFWHADNAKLAKVQDFLLSNISGIEGREGRKRTIISHALTWERFAKFHVRCYSSY